MASCGGFGDHARRGVEMVELDPIDEEDTLMLKKLISNHLSYTKSTVAGFILNDFDNQLKNFVKVFPSDYKKVLQKATKKITHNS